MSPLKASEVVGMSAACRMASMDAKVVGDSVKGRVLYGGMVES